MPSVIRVMVFFRLRGNLSEAVRVELGSYQNKYFTRCCAIFRFSTSVNLNMLRRGWREKETW